MTRLSSRETSRDGTKRRTNGMRIPRTREGACPPVPVVTPRATTTVRGQSRIAMATSGVDPRQLARRVQGSVGQAQSRRTSTGE